MSHYNKLIAGIVGSVVGFIISLAAYAGFAVCPESGFDVAACTVLGLSQSQMTAALMLVISNMFVWLGPRNT